MIFEDDRVRMTRHGFRRTRAAAARPSDALNDIRPLDGLWEAILAGLPPAIQAEGLEFFETGRSPLTGRDSDKARLTSPTP